MKRVAIFIDGSNLYHGLKNLFGHARLDFRKFVAKLSSGYDLYRTYYYNAVLDQSINPETYRKQQAFFNQLRELPYFEIRLGVLKQREHGPKEKGVDVMIAVDMLSMAYKNQYDVAILVSGDGDYAELAKAVKDAGKHVINAYFESSRSDALRYTCDASIRLDRDFFADLLLEGGPEAG